MKITRRRPDPTPFLGTYLRDANGLEAQATRAHRLARLDRDIARLERWHHEWRLTHDAGYRELYAEELEERRRRASKDLAMDYHGTTDDERRAATRRMAEWGRGSA